MTGDWVAQVARRFVHSNTFALVVSPAIADLQFEEDTQSTRARLAGYLAVWVAVAGGVWQDLVYDRRRPVWADDVSVVMTLAFLVASYHLSMLTLVLGFDHRLDMGFIGRLLANMTGDRPVTMIGVVFVVAALFVATKAHATESTDRAGAIDG